MSKPREILLPFVDDMVLAIMAGRKTNTRRVPTLRQFQQSTTPGYDWQFKCHRGLWQDFRHADFLASKYVPLKVGDRIGVRESARLIDIENGHYSTSQGGRVRLKYRADGAESDWLEYPSRLKWLHIGKSIPNGVFKEGVRTWLEVTGVRIERLNEISEADAIAEGIEQNAVGAWKHYENPRECFQDPRRSFASLWESIYGEDSFDDKWVIVTEFKRGVQWHYRRGNRGRTSNATDAGTMLKCKQRHRTKLHTTATS